MVGLYSLEQTGELGGFHSIEGDKAFPTAKEPDMDWNRFEGNWKQLKGSVKAQWGKLTDDDMTVINGNREQLEGKLQERYGYSKDQVHQQLDDWSRTLKS
jgi:uncharacterized protein YjbJ (UPF0337 family)